MARRSKGRSADTLLGRLAERLGVPINASGEGREAFAHGRFASREIGLAIIGQTSAGKSALVNGIFGREVSVERMSSDTTDKIYEIRLENGNVVHDTPGVGNDEQYEAVTRAFLGMEGPGSDEYPLCVSKDGTICPHLQAVDWEVEGEAHRVRFAPLVARHDGFRRAERRHERHPERHSAPRLCRQDHKCGRLEFSNERQAGPVIDLVLFVFGAAQGLNGSLKRFANEVRRFCADEQIPLVWALTYRDGLSSADLITAREDHEDYGFKPIHTVDCKSEGGGLDELVHALVKAAPAGNVEAFNTVVAERFRVRRPELLGLRIRDAVSLLLETEEGRAIRDKRSFQKLLVEVRRSFISHYKVREYDAGRSAALSWLQRQLEEETELPEEVRKSIQRSMDAELDEFKKQRRKVDERAREDVLQNWFSRLLNEWFGAWKGDVEEREQELVSNFDAHIKRLRQSRKQRLEASKGQQTDLLELGRSLFIYLESLLFWLEGPNRGHRPNKHQTQRWKEDLAVVFDCHREKISSAQASYDKDKVRVAVGVLCASTAALLEQRLD